jgi:hypothetical protein
LICSPIRWCWGRRLCRRSLWSSKLYSSFAIRMSSIKTVGVCLVDTRCYLSFIS